MAARGIEMTDADFFAHLERIQFLPLVSCEQSTAEKTVSFFLSQGIDTVEVPLRSDFSVSTIRFLKNRFPDLTLLAGTVLTPNQVVEASEAGAAAIVSPGWSEDVYRVSAERSLPYIPGVFTATEVQNAFSHGCRYLKFFPAAAVGVGYLNALASPFFSAGVRFMPTGGINHRNYRSFLELPSVFCVAGSDFESVFFRDDSE